MKTQKIKANYLDIVKRKIYPAEITIKNGLIADIRKIDSAENFILPGFVDSHIHIESSMVSPGEFSRTALKHGTVAVVSDPHEIANVCGIKGIDFMIASAKNADLKFYFGAPSCVPATDIESSGARIDASDINKLLARKDIFFLAEMMNFPGVLFDNKNVIDKLNAAVRYKKPIDGHAPGLKGKDLKKYIKSGISTDHETLDYAEAEEKIKNGMIVQIREGSATKSFDELKKLIDKYPSKVMLCSDDLHPDDLQKGHINLLVKRGMACGLDIYDLVQSYAVNPIKHYKLDTGYVQKGHPADFIVVNNLKELKVLSTFINGKEVYNSSNNRPIKNSTKSKTINNFNAIALNKVDLRIESKTDIRARIIGIVDRLLYTKVLNDTIKSIKGQLCSDLKNDYLKLVVVNRYNKSMPAIGFVHGFGLKKGAVAASVAHDSHNIVAIGTNDVDLVNAINIVINSKGGISFVEGKIKKEMKLPIAGLMTNKPVDLTASEYKALHREVKKAGSKLTSPLMTLSFLSLIVIPELKLSDKGLFDVKKFALTSLKE